jgi:deazaflavin-dependent oxidoreductase (nitroreductase family)
MTTAKDWNSGVIAEFRANGGRLGGGFEGAPVLLLTTTGRRSGRRHTTPMMYMALDGDDRLAVFASKSGADTDPDWYLNLVADPDVTVEVGTDLYRATAAPVHGPERDRIYAEQARRYPGFADYQERTSRVIPVVLLSSRAEVDG